MLNDILKTFLDEICLLLDTYKGRDKILRTLCYSTKFIGGINQDASAREKFLIFSKHMSAARATLRLLDDLPMLKYTLEYGLGREEPDRFMSSVGVIMNIIDQVYYPIEKMAWLAEYKLITGKNNDKWDTASSVCWVASIYLGLIKTLRYVAILQNEKKCFLVKNEDKSNMEKLIALQKFEMLTCLRLSLDLVHAINTLPPGFLWSSKLQTWHVGLIGTLSSFLGLYQIFAKRSLK